MIYVEMIYLVFINIGEVSNLVDELENERVCLDGEILDGEIFV